MPVTGEPIPTSMPAPEAAPTEAPQPAVSGPSPAETAASEALVSNIEAAVSSGGPTTALEDLAGQEATAGPGEAAPTDALTDAGLQTGDQPPTATGTENLTVPNASSEPVAETDAPTAVDTAVEQSDLPVEDRLVESTSNKVAAERAVAEAEKRGASEEELATLRQKAAEANDNYKTTLVERDQAIIDGRMLDIQKNVGEMQKELQNVLSKNQELEGKLGAMAETFDKATKDMLDLMDEKDPGKREIKKKTILAFLAIALLTFGKSLVSNSGAPIQQGARG